MYASRQESCQKDVERAFGILQFKFTIVAGSSRYWKKKILHDIMISCIIMYNMIIEDEREVNVPTRDARPTPPTNVEMMINEDMWFDNF